MPQLEIGDYTPQLVWLAITFILLYVLMWRLALPRVATVLADRDRHIEEDLARAERLKGEADQALRGYQAALAQARTEAQRLHRETAAAMSALAAKREQAFGAALSARTRDAEQQIEAAKRQALSELPQIAAEVAGSAFQRLTGESALSERIGAAVVAVLKGSA